jgi:hypothetical protein
MADQNEGTGAPLGDLLPKELREKLEAAHGEIVAVETKAGVAAFKVFNAAAYDRYNKMIFDEKQRPMAFRALVLTCCVHPESALFQQWLDKYPGITQTCLAHVLELGGVNAEAEAKKYGSG